VRSFALVSIVFFLTAVGFAQQTQTSDVTNTQPLQSTNVKYVQGVGPGYWPTAGAGLTLNLAKGTAFCGGAVASYAGGTLTMTNSTTNYVYLNTSSSCVPAVKTTTFTSSDIPIAVVVTSGGAITAITDDRTWFVPSSSSGGVTSVTCGTGLTGGTFTTTGTCALTTPVTAANGGTGQTTYTKGDLLCASGSTTLVKLAVGTNGQVLTSDSTAACGVSWGGGGGSGTSITPVQKVACEVTNSGSATFGCAFPGSVTSGHLIIAVCGEWTSNSISTHTIADSQVNTFTSLGTTGLNTGNSNSNMWAWSAIAGSSAADTLTCTFTAGTNNYIVVLLEYAATTVDASNFVNVGNATTTATNTAITSHVDNLLEYCIEPTSDGSLIVSTSGFTSELSSGVSTISYAVSDKGGVAAGSISTSCFRNPNAPIHAGLIAFY
jgi:hypothetical protein